MFNMKMYEYIYIYTEYAGLEIAVDLCIASPFSLQIVIGNGRNFLNGLSIKY